MSGLFKKLNTLVRASINETLDFSSDRTSEPSQRGTRRMEKDVRRLRERINEAIDYEDGLQAKVDTLQAEITRLDREADIAVQQGKDATARHLIDQMQRTQQRLVMAEADLRQHRAVAEELIQQVNQMEAALADNQYAERQSGPATAPESPPQSESPPAKRVTIPVAGQGNDEANPPSSKPDPVETASETINAAADRIARMRETLTARQEAQERAPTGDDAPDNEAIESDLTNRRNRLARPPDSDK